MKRNGRLPGYAQIIQPSLTCFMGMLLAWKCGVDDPVVNRAIAKTLASYASFTGRGALNYGGKTGKEFTFGLRMEEALAQPVLLIKVAWGGKSLHTDFRPPTAGPMVGKSAEESGRLYRMMMAHVKAVLADVGRVVPGYDSAQGYELGGFVWLQGWNDMVDPGVYPKRAASETKALQCIDRFGPVGIGIELHQPALHASRR